MSSNSTQLNKEHLLGTWHLSAFEGRAQDGFVELPYTDKPQGMLMYDSDGTMMVILMKPDRPLFESNDLAGGTNEELRAAFEVLPHFP